MSKVVVPINQLTYPDEASFPLEIAALFEDEEEGCSINDHFTYTKRYQVEQETTRDKIRRKLRHRLPTDQAERLIKLMEDNDWDVSFFVDTY